MGARKKVSKRDVRNIFKCVTKQQMISSQIRADLQQPVTTRRVRQILQNRLIRIGEKKPKPKLTERHREYWNLPAST